MNIHFSYSTMYTVYRCPFNRAKEHSLWVLFVQFEQLVCISVQKDTASGTSGWFILMVSQIICLFRAFYCRLFCKWGTA